MAWAFDAPSGVYKDHALSSKIREAAVANFRFARWADTEPGYGKGRGQSVTITRLSPLPLANKVGESEMLPTGRPLISTKQTTVSEWGYTIETTNFERNLSHFDIKNKFQRALRDQITGTVDKAIADAMKSTLIKFVSTSATAGTFTSNGTPSGSATNNLGIDHLRAVYDYLSGTLKAPTFSNGKYVGILSTKAARGIKSDVIYERWQAPTTSEPHISGQLKDVEGFALFETNHFNALLNAIGGSSVTGEAVFFGMDPAFLAMVEDPELRSGLPRNLGRFQDFGWVGMFEAGLPWDNASEARVVHWSST